MDLIFAWSSIVSVDSSVSAAISRLAFVYQSSFYHGQLADSRGVDQLRAARSDGGDDLQPHAESSRQIDARLDAEDHSFFQWLGVAADDEWRLVHLHAKSVARPVDEVIAVSRLRDVIAGGAI